jgi:hypothetical protein
MEKSLDMANTPMQQKFNHVLGPQKPVCCKRGNTDLDFENINQLKSFFDSTELFPDVNNFHKTIAEIQQQDVCENA